MLNQHTDEIYEIKDNYLLATEKKTTFVGTSSKSMQDLINSGIQSKNEYNINLVEKDDKIVFIDSFKNKTIDLSDLNKIGECSSAMQAALIAHVMKEYQYDDYITGHEQGLILEALVYGELVGNNGINYRTTIGPLQTPENKAKFIFKYDNSNSYEIISGGSFIEKDLNNLGKIIEYKGDGRIISVTKQ